MQILKGKGSSEWPAFSRLSKLFVTLEQEAAKFNYVITTDQSGVFLKIAAQYDHALKLDWKKLSLEETHVWGCALLPHNLSPTFNMKFWGENKRSIEVNSFHSKRWSLKGWFLKSLAFDKLLLCSERTIQNVDYHSLWTVADDSQQTRLLKLFLDDPTRSKNTLITLLTV